MSRLQIPDVLVHEGMILGSLIREAEQRFDYERGSARKKGKVRGAQIAAEHANEHATLREAAAKMKPTLSKRAKAENLKKKKQFRHLSVETIRKLL